MIEWNGYTRGNCETHGGKLLSDLILDGCTGMAQIDEGQQMGVSLKLKQPTCRAGQAKHAATVEVWILKNGFHDSLLDGKFDCSVSTQGWNKEWQKFKPGTGHVIYSCDPAFQELKNEARRVGLIW